MTTSSGCCEAMTIMEAAAARAEPWLQVCGPHDFGMHEYGCMCKSGDPRPVISSLPDDPTQMEMAHSQYGWVYLTDSGEISHTPKETSE